jgi:hypothetical protein
VINSTPPGANNRRFGRTARSRQLPPRRRLEHRSQLVTGDLKVVPSLSLVQMWRVVVEVPRWPCQVAACQARPLLTCMPPLDPWC